ncbi:MAG: TerC family protein [Candidatus Aquicultorales bacterium]
MTDNVWFWAAFNLFVVAMLALDLVFAGRRDREMKLREALGWSSLWIGLAFAFNALIYVLAGPRPAGEFLTGYLIEKSLSIDNIFVFLMIFGYFGVEPRCQKPVLFWGVLGALAMRAVFILAGVAVIERFHWIVYFFGGILILSGIKMVLHKESEVYPDRNLVVRIFRRFVPVAEGSPNGRFFVRRNGRLMATSLMVVLLMIETSDLIFAVDSIPAVLAISKDPFIVYTSNVFAILGLRALYFAVSGVMGLFRYLHFGLSAILVFVGAKMLVAEVVDVPIWATLSFIVAVVGASIAASMAFPKRVPELNGGAALDER